MIRLLIEMIAAFVACTGFSMIYQTKIKQLYLCGLAASITWACYRLVDYISENEVFLSFLIAAAFGTVVAEIMARHTKTPATVYLIPALLPMVPGGSLYYTTHAIVISDRAGAAYYGRQTALSALGIALGLVIVSVIMFYYNQSKNKE